MNLFYLHDDPAIAARYHNDKHVVKMIVETAQMLSTAHRLIDGIPEKRPSKSGKTMRTVYHLRDLCRFNNYDDKYMINVHEKHPCSIWIRENRSNYGWARALFQQLCYEYTHRYGKRHSCEQYSGAFCRVPYNMPDGPLTEPPQAIDEDLYPGCRVPGDPVTAYRNYYRVAKSHFNNYTNREIPHFLNTTELRENKSRDWVSFNLTRVIEMRAIEQKAYFNYV